MQAVVIGTLALIPLVFLPLTEDMFIPIKWTFLVSGSLAVLFLWAIRLAQKGEVHITVSKATIGFGALFVFSLVTLFVASKNRIEAILDPFGPATWISLTLLVVCCTHSFGDRSKRALSWIMLLTASIIAISSILSHLDLLKTVAPTVAFLAARSWTPLGNITALPWLALILVPILIKEGDDALKRRDAILLVCIFFVAVILVASVSFYALLPAGERISLPFVEGWRVMTQSWSAPIQAIFGVGIENYMSAFAQGRSTALNTSALWNIRFGQGSSLLFHLATTMGLSGLLGLLLLSRSFLSPRNSPLFIALLLAPPSIPLLSFITGVALVTSAQEKLLTIRIPSHLSWMRPAAVLVVMAAAGSGIYLAGRALVSELTFMNSLQARASGDGKTTYELQIAALDLNPWSTRIHLAFSQINFDLANAIARSANKQTVNEQDRQTITTLIQQAIREAKIATNIAPQNILAWENLALLYQNLTNVAQGADQWAVAAYQRAIILDPTNPLLRVSFATLLGNLGDTDNAFTQFQNAAALKPDYALAHYSLAKIYRERQQYLPEALSLVAALRSVSKRTEDEAQVETELETAKTHLTDQERAQIDQLLGIPTQDTASQLTSPIPDNPPQLKPKLELPSESSPGALPQR